MLVCRYVYIESKKNEREREREKTNSPWVNFSPFDNRRVTDWRRGQLVVCSGNTYHRDYHWRHRWSCVSQLVTEIRCNRCLNYPIDGRSQLSQGLPYRAKRSANIFPLSFFFSASSLSFFIFFPTLPHWVIPSSYSTLGGDCVDNDLYSAFLFLFFFSLFLSSSLLSSSCSMNIDIDRSISIMHKYWKTWIFLLHSLSSLPYRISPTFGKWCSVWICFVVQRENPQQRQARQRRRRRPIAGWNVN